MGTVTIYYETEKLKVTQSCPTLCDPMDCIVHGILQARTLEWVAFSFSRGSFPTQGSNPGLLYCRQILYQLSHKGSPRILQSVAYPFSRDLPDPGIEPGSPALQADSLPTELSGKPKSLQAFGPKTQNIKQKQYCNKLNKDLKK